MATVTPEDRLTNLIACLQDTAQQKQRPGQLDELRSIAAHLAELWNAYQAGQVYTDESDTPF